MLDEDLMIIGREVVTVDGKRIDLLGINQDGHLTIIELKRDKSPRDTVGQILEYASWASSLKTPDIVKIAENYFTKNGTPSRLHDAFRAHFNVSMPDELNASHQMLIVAGSLDEKSKRIVQYLSEAYDVPINTAFFNVFSDGGQQYLSADWLMDQSVVEERADAKTRAPWHGAYYVNISESSEGRQWEDMLRYGFVSAGGGSRWSDKLKKLDEGNPIYVHVTGAGYVGYGIVLAHAIPASEFKVDGIPLFELPTAGNYKKNMEDPDRAEYVVPIRWVRTVSKDEAKKFHGYFASTHVVCKLRQRETLDYLSSELGGQF